MAEEATPEQIAACERAMDRLDALADEWAIEIDLPTLIKAATCPMDLSPKAPAEVRQKFRGRMESQIDAIVRQAFIEAYQRAGDSRKEYDEIHMSHLRAEIEKAKEERDELEQLFNLQWEADQRAIKRWQAAHPGNDHVWPDRADMVVWLMEQHSSNPAAAWKEPGDISPTRGASTGAVDQIGGVAPSPPDTSTVSSKDGA